VAAAQSVTINQPTAVTFTFAKTDVTCHGGSNGTIEVLPVGGSGTGYEVALNGVYPASNPISGLTANTYRVKVRDSNGCESAEQSIIITQPDALTLTTTPLHVKCFNGNDGQIDLTVAGGTGPNYTYSWDNGSFTQDITNLVAGNYCVTVYDAFQCTATTCQTITQPSQLIVTFDVTDISCNGGSNGIVVANPSGGTGSYTYLWSNGQTSQIINNLVSGNYCVTVFDANNCQVSDCDSVYEPGAIVLTINPVHVTCFGLTNGSLDLTVTGGTGSSYLYQWNNGATTQDINNLAAGNYCVTVRDVNNCQASRCENVTQPNQINITSVVTNVSCFGLSDGSIDLSVSGGTPGPLGYSYLWSPNNQTTEDISGLVADDYSVTVTDVNGCTATSLIDVTQPSQIIITLNVSHVRCFGEQNGSVQSVVQGGTIGSGYQYQWSDGSTTSNIQNLAAGNYCLTVADANNCTASACDDVNQPAQALTVSAILNNDISCHNANDAQITATASGGNPVSYNYTLDGSNYNTSGVFAGLAAGAYTVTVVDANGCQTESAPPINVTNPPFLGVSAVLDNNITCHNDNDAQITATGVGGRGTLTYALNGGAYQAGNVFSNLSAGTYTVTVKDSANCTATSSLAITVTNPAVLTVSLVLNNNITCHNFNDAVVTASGNGGTTPYEYSITGPNGSFQPSGTFSALAAGTYRIDIRDAHGCTAVSNSVTVTNPALLEVTVTKTDVNCFGGNDGTATAAPTGGTVSGPYQYEWNSQPVQTTQVATGLPQGTFNVTVTDDNGCTVTASVAINQPATAVTATVSGTNVSCYGGNDGTASVTAEGGTVANDYIYVWSNAQTTANISGLVAGQYSVTVFDDNGCEVSSVITITQPDLLLVTIELDSNAYCNNNGHGQLTASVNGGTQPYSYLWSDNQNQTTPTATNLSSGSYTVTVTDANGCTAQRTRQVFERPGPNVAGYNIVRSTCFKNNGSITLSVSTNDNPLSYSWSHDVSLNAPAASGLYAGAYTVTITDLATCDTVVTITIADIPGVQITGADVKNSYCDKEDGMISISTASGTPPFTFKWSHRIYETGPTVEFLSPGQYSVTVVDANQCDTSATYTISNIQAPDISIDQASPQTILKGQEVMLSVSVLSALDSVLYEWIPNSSVRCYLSVNDCDTVLAQPDVSTIYMVKVTDLATGCYAYDTITVIVRDGKKIFIPNAITPNGDGVNDVWNIKDIAEFKNTEVIIINRWGDEIFSAKPYKNDWDGTYKGKPLPAGTYYYILKIDELGQVINGNITIIK
jgi:gliding motility-associated-like protein